MDRWADIFVRWMPDAFAVALVLTLVTVACAVGVVGYPLEATVQAWGDGFWNLLKFTNQITLTLLLGYALANTPPVERLLHFLAGRVRSAPSAYMTACGMTGVLALISWGLSLVSAGIVARAIGKACRERGIKVHYPLLVASSFSGFVIWHQGLTSSVGLAIATPDHFLSELIGVVPTSATLFTTWNILLALGILCTLPFVMARLHPRDAEKISEIEGEEEGEADSHETLEALTPARKLDRSRWLILPFLVMAIFYLAAHFFIRGQGLELNILNFAFLFAGIALAGSAARYAEIILNGGRVAAPFLLQYPFYAGIAGIMAESGLAARIIEFFVSISSAATLPLYAFLSAGLLNIFIPSGGGQWAVQGPLMMAAATEAGADIPRVAMAVALGDQWTNLIQPLTLMPVLAIAQLAPRDILAYTFVALLFTGVVFSGALLL
ncbi:MAG: TIGR00366 family protein [Myxococcota bacterium]|jgi:short-chain fatty acids transporter|nr:TIGR00366 family protein [Myxococcota bacterium]